jgi:hypothetical protein
MLSLIVGILLVVLMGRSWLKEHRRHLRIRRELNIKQARERAELTARYVEASYRLGEIRERSDH